MGFCCCTDDVDDKSKDTVPPARPSTLALAQARYLSQRTMSKSVTPNLSTILEVPTPLSQLSQMSVSVDPSNSKIIPHSSTSNSKSMDGDAPQTNTMTRSKFTFQNIPKMMPGHPDGEEPIHIPELIDEREGNNSLDDSCTERESDDVPSLSVGISSIFQTSMQDILQAIKGKQASPSQENCSDAESTLTQSNQSQETNIDSLQSPQPKGVSVHYLNTIFLEEVKKYGKDPIESTIYDIEDLREHDVNGLIRQKGEKIYCPIDKRIGAAYVDCLEGEDNVGTANYMLSYTWGNTIMDIVDTLISVCNDLKLDTKKTYVWICCLCINQHRVVEDQKNGDVVPFPVFQQSFQEKVLGIRNMISLMTPWNKPLYLNRVWCIFELYTAIENDCNLIIAMPPREKESLIKFCTAEDGTNEDLVDILNDRISTKIQNADASVEEDLDRILLMVKNGPGFSPLNQAVNQRIRAWMRRSIDQMLKDDKSLRLNTNAFILLSDR